MIRKMALCGMVLMLAACSTTNSSSRTTGTRIAKNQTPIAKSDQSAGVFKVGNTYSVKGKRYQPRETYSFSETGTASWYGPQFHGKKTANGEVFDKYELTAAHKTLQMPSMIKVTNLDNGRSAILRVNDRGPFAHNRVLDVSEKAAEVLGFKNNGTARVKIDLLERESKMVANLARQGLSTHQFEVAMNQKGGAPATKQATVIIPTRKPDSDIQIAAASPVPTPPPTARLRTPLQIAQKPTFAPATNNIFVQAGSFGQHQNAQAFAQKLQVYGPATITPADINGSRLYRVRVGPFRSERDANTVRTQLAMADLGNPVIIVE